ncbi:ribosome 60S biogenesis N-terminal-domain-containing protein [Scheffersomyces amazonensis]|uniref:ribosome 60S biogenesis N-terminal-domain-containing protein n=1 Tax=Scheffersomyces amazonensis TaxID=1078765 RepID=UPI00315D7E00
MSSKRSLPSSSNVDTLLLENITRILSEKDHNAMLELFESSHNKIERLISNWSYFSSINDHHQFIDVSVKLSKISAILVEINNNDEKSNNLDIKIKLETLKPSIITAYKSILTTHIKVIYRALNNARAALTNPNLRILTNMINFDSTIAIEILNNFDLSLSSLPNLLIPPKVPTTSKNDKSLGDHLIIRVNFIKWWFTFNTNLPNYHRKDVLTTNFKIMNNLWKFIYSDSEATIKFIIEFIDKSILNEPHFKKSTKCKILNDNFMHKYQPLFSRFDKEEWFITFSEKLVSDSVYGLTFPNPRVWYSSSSNNSSGVSISVNNKSFKINNKLIYTFLTTLKPTESFQQLSFVMTILKSNPELIAPYFNYLVQHGGGYHDPSLTSWWIAHSLLYSTILQIPIIVVQDEDVYDTSTKFNIKLIADCIIPAAISKQAITKSLTSNKPLIIQLTLQILIHILTNVERILKIVDNKQGLLDIIKVNLPEINTIIQTFEKHEKEDEDGNKLIKLSSLMVINKLSAITDSGNSNVSKLANNGINLLLTSLTTISHYDLSLLDNYLSIQTNQQQTSQEFKWWNKTSSTSSSFFTSLIKLSINKSVSDVSSTSFNWKIVSLLVKLCQTNRLLFNRSLLESPLVALIQALSDLNTVVDDNIWNLVDESISRSVRSPYKYLDLSHSTYDDISIFVVAIFEQFKFIINKENDITTRNHTEFLLTFIRYLIVVGESKISLLKLWNTYVDEDIRTKNISQLDILEFDGNMVENPTEINFLKYILTSPITYLNKSLTILEKKLPTTDMEFAALVLKLQLIVQSELSISTDALIIELISKLGNYLISKPSTHLIDYIISSKFWGSLFLSNNEIDEKKILFGGLFSEVLQQLSIKSINVSPLNQYVYEQFNSCETLSVQYQLYISNFGWLLTNSQLQSIKINKSNDLLKLTIASLYHQRNMVISVASFNDIRSINGELEQKKSDILSKLVHDNLIDFEDDLPIIIKTLVDSKQDYYLLNGLLESTDSKTRHLVIEYLSIMEFNENNSQQVELLCFVASSLAKAQAKATTPNDIRTDKIFQLASKVTLRALKNNNILESNWSQTLNILTQGINGFTHDEKVEVVEDLFKYVDTHGFKFSVIPEFAKFLSSIRIIIPPINNWIHKSMLYITKKFAESEHLSSNFQDFLNEIGIILMSDIQVWKIVPSSILNSQLEVILNHSRWISESLYLKYINILIMAGNKSSIAFEKLLQIFINNEANLLSGLPSTENYKSRYFSSLIIFNLFNLDPTKNSKSTLLGEKLILFYLGSIRSEDIVIKHLLIKIESYTMKSWINKVSNWEFIEELSNNDIELIGEDRLITSDGKNSLVVSLNKNFIKNSIINMTNISIQFPTINGKINSKWQLLESFFNKSESLINSSYGSTIYDPEFLMMLIINNEELVKVESSESDNIKKPKFDIKKLIDSNILQFIVMSLSNPTVCSISKILLNGIADSLQDESESESESENNNNGFKDSNIYKVYVSNILNTLRKDIQIPSLIWYIYSSFVPILSNPGHFLYEKSFRYVLSNPNLKSNDIPLYSNIILSKTNDSETENDESYYKQIVWLIESLIEGTTTSEDLDLIKFRSVIEWIMNLTNSPFISMRIKTLILKFLYIIQSIDQGADMLVTRFGILTSLDQYLLRVNNEDYAKKDTLIKHQLQINIEQVILRLGIVGLGSKRIRNWTEEDLPNYVKRIHKSCSV